MKSFYPLFLFLLIPIFSFAQDKPIAVNDTVIAISPGVFEVSVLDNDYDPNGESIYIDKVYSNDNYDIEQEGDKIIFTPHSYGIFQSPIKYKIRNESGISEKPILFLCLRRMRMHRN